MRAKMGLRKRGLRERACQYGSQMEKLEVRQMLAASLVHDLNAAPIGISPQDMTALEGRTLFIGRDLHGVASLWQTDGTVAGTGAVGGLPSFSDLEKVGDTVFAWGNAGFARTDGTPAGTVILNTGIHSPEQFVQLGGVTFFISRSEELWRTDGTPAGTQMIHRSYASTSSAYIRNLTSVNGALYFVGSASPATGYELWTSDGTDGGTRMVKELYPGINHSFPSFFVGMGGHTYFLASTPTGNGLFRTDGTADGTVRIQASSVMHEAPTVVGDHLYYRMNIPRRGVQIMWTDGTPGVAAEVHHEEVLTSRQMFTYQGKLFYGANNSFGTPYIWRVDGPGIKPVPTLLTDSYTATVVGEALFMTIMTPGLGRELYVSDGTVEGTRLLADINAGAAASLPGEFFEMNSAYFFWATDAEHGRELWTTNGTAEGTKLVKDVVPGSAGPTVGKGVVNDGLLLLPMGGTGQSGLWRSDGTEQGTFALNVGTRSSDASPMFSFKDMLLFHGSSHDQSGVWTLRDGETIPSYLLPYPPGYYPPYPGRFLPAGDRLLFARTDAESGNELWSTDGTAAGTSRLMDLFPGPESSQIELLTTQRGGVLFTARTNADNWHLWWTDGKGSSPRHVLDIRAVSATGFGIVHKTSNDVVYFYLNNQRDIWRTDGTAEGTFRVLQNAPQMWRPTGALGELLLFVNEDPVHGIELWKSDGTVAGTGLLKDLRPGPASSTVSFMGSGGGIALFREGSTSRIWRTDGTTEGTYLLPLSTEGAPRSGWAIHGGSQFFLIGEGAELWTTDGSSSPKFVKDFFSDGTLSITDPTVVGDLLYFIADGVDGAESQVWRSDGTAEGTLRVTDVRPWKSYRQNSVYTGPRDLVVHDGSLHYSLEDPEHGRELWRIPRPTAVGGAYSVNEGASVRLDGSASFDPDANETVSYAWDLDGDGVFGETGAAAGRGDEVGATPVFSAAGLDGPSTYTAKLRVSNSVGLTHAVDVAISVQNVAPTLRLGLSPRGSGLAFTGGGSFVDPAPGDTFVGMVDYGDGTGSQPLVLNADRTFALTHTYAAAGTYTVSVSLSDDDGGAAAGSIVVNAEAPPRLLSVVINDGSTQRSKVNSITVTFDKPVTLEPGAVKLSRRTRALPAQVQTVVTNPSGDGRTFVVTFKGKEIVGGSLSDGIYDLVVNNGLVRDVFGQTPAAKHITTLHRLFGDLNGNRDVTGLELATIVKSRTRRTPANRWYMDYEGDGDIDVLDVLQATTRLPVKLR